MVWTQDNRYGAWIPWAQVVPGSLVSVTMSKIGNKVVATIDCTAFWTGKRVVASRSFSYINREWPYTVGVGYGYSWTQRNVVSNARLVHEWKNTTFTQFAERVQKGWIVVGVPSVFTVK